MLKSFKNALRGIFISIKEERNLKIIFIVFIIVVAAGLVFSLSIIQWIIILLCCALVISAEMINSSIENAIDLYTDEYSQLARKAKDIAAGSTLIVSIFSAVIGLLIFIPRIIEFFSQ